MKRNILAYAMLTILSLSCSDWLNVTPEDIIEEDKLFEHGNGYRNALSGIYKQMSSNTMYGQELTWGFMDVLANCYHKGSGGIGEYHKYYLVSKNYDYELEVGKGIISAIWSDTYNCIANCNNILKRIDKEDHLKFELKELEKNVIHGEALALRAILHFDILRLFAPGMIEDDSKKYMPYKKVYPQTFESYISSKEVLENCINDLLNAKNLVATYDTMDTKNKNLLTLDLKFDNEFGDDSYAPEDMFFAFRGYKMNYIAINAYLARIYNYMGNHAMAEQFAKEVIYFKNDDDRSVINFTPKNDLLDNRKMVNDIIFTLSYPKLFEDYYYYAQLDGNNTCRLCITQAMYDELFDDVNDYRGYSKSSVGLFNMDNSGNNTYYIPNRNINITIGGEVREIDDMIPMIRLSEMYYILAESKAAEGDFVGATSYLDEVRSRRGCAKGKLEISDMISFKRELFREVKKDYFGEGQLFFYYKKYNELIPGTQMQRESFVFPLPDNEFVH